ncbi:hypothetical protein AVEN_195103-1 [Araneus ventricosus]|uniref:Uncharacterized protein n=1 Tax=Araneus ventricosus TaxID=182803 RepID=A0A4Y2BHK3_ARAVE|nr:hypothetical protein AVEN_195103-1 [Araneus ventricosus]
MECWVSSLEFSEMEEPWGGVEGGDGAPWNSSSTPSPLSPSGRQMRVSSSRAKSNTPLVPSPLSRIVDGCRFSRHPRHYRDVLHCQVLSIVSLTSRKILLVNSL